MRNDDALWKSLKSLSAARQASKRAEWSVETAERLVEEKKREAKVAAMEFEKNFWASGGGMIFILYACHSERPDEMTIRSKVKSLSDENLYLYSNLAAYEEVSEVGKNLKKFSAAHPPSGFEYVVSLGVLPDKLTLVCFGDQYYENNGKQWVRMK